MQNFLYTFISWRYPWRVKVGISSRPRGRRREVACALKSYTVGPYLWMPWARLIEKAIHTVFAPLNTQTGWIRLERLPKVVRYVLGEIPDYSGKTEHFWILNIVSGILATFGAYLAGANTDEIRIAALLVVIFPLPFDIIICVCLYWLVQVFILKIIWPYAGLVLNLICSWFEYQFLNFWHQ